MVSGNRGTRLEKAFRNPNRILSVIGSQWMDIEELKLIKTMSWRAKLSMNCYNLYSVNSMNTGQIGCICKPLTLKEPARK